MKRIFSLLALVTLVALLLPSTAFANINQPTNTEQGVAQNAAQAWLNRAASAAGSEIPQWQNAVVTTPQTYHNLDGEIDAYLFSINNDADGYVLVGSSLYGYNMFQAGTSPPPAIPSADKVKSAIIQSELKVETSTIGRPIELLYTGVDGFYAVYLLSGQKIAVNLVYGDANLVSSLKATMPTPGEYQARKNSVPMSILTTGYATLNMTYWNNTNPAWCGPCSGVSIGAYYRDYQGYSNLPSNGDMYTDLYYSMYTYLFSGATMPGYYGPGFLAMADDAGYNNFDTEWWYAGPEDYQTIIDDIDSGWPEALVRTSGWHWRAIRGYYWVEDWQNVYSIICTNSQTSDSYEFLDWMNLDGINALVRITD